ncbi:SMC-Scp complex subunit ScpB [Corynebacterium macginleyi]|uniref:SMC-Scp complex subunit ScpB n=1 Tax=Corynebacterium macginleyi TaxID=38290 RepID=A0A3M0GMM0_9CORY|nr:SMC-Scp complex subunit ScpB [Corynebacterium macginleyi]MBK4138768.1 SMC-Scp complex subunit ScpB [Corynebacterium macginleyi]MBK4140881.1 SMC-Scp complex subunit ScpB [Corynebacterium macginleyi]MBK4143188.1 SMC-Scp complex subunit ScpB [Corynebacterium macginleyi]MBK4146759.1 SMC-Scp complex subunit ScpB [Corynebacterium macginleyi]MBK4148648.1 SMC-Scp complex subunit ScpB [Corynebacterium macginleyi]
MDLPLISQLRSRLESILLVLDSPASVESFARTLSVEPAVISDCLRAIQREFDSRGSGIELREMPTGWRLYTRQENASAVEEFLLDGAQTKLSRAALETLAVVAYRQPVTRQQVSAVRGVNVDGVMRTLNLRGLIRELPQEEFEGASHRYETTELFLELLGIDSLERLPDLAPLLPDVDAIDEEY